MSTMPVSKISPKKEPLPPLENGDHLDQETFHERYEAMPKNARAELIGGIVYMASPVTLHHSKEHGTLMGWLGLYMFSTPAIDLLDNPTVILAKDCEPQPDAVLRRQNGATKVVLRNEREYIAGPPELVAEVSYSSESIDLHHKRNDYEKHGVPEYVAFLVRTRSVVWLVRENGKFVDLKPGADGILQSRIFPGLWLDPGALLTGDMRRMQEVLNQGIASPEHAEFAQQLGK